MSSQPQTTNPTQSEQEQINLIKSHDVLLLLQHLAQREEVTVKIILDCLYDIGASNIIHNKLRSRPLKIILGTISKLSKPAFRVVAYYWFKKNCPELITNWLLDQVKFEPATTAIVEVEADYTSASIKKNEEIKSLYSQVRLLKGILIIVVLAFSSSFIWLFHNIKPQLTLDREPTPNSVVRE